MSEALVSVVIPTYYRNKRLRNAIRSVKDQSYPSVEVIVVDDSGEGHASPVVSAEGVKYLRLDENRGAQTARNKGVERANGSYVQLLDDDDVLFEDKISRQVELLTSASRVGVAYCGMELESGRIRTPNPEFRGQVLEQALRFDLSTCVPSTMLIERELLSTIHPVQDFLGADDVGLIIELAKRTDFEFVDEALIKKGEPERMLGESWDAIRGRQMLFRGYRSLYQEFPRETWEAALSDTYRLTGRRYVKDSLWSKNAIAAYRRALRYAPTVDPILIGELVAATFGRPGHTLASNIFEKTSQLLNTRLSCLESETD